MEASTLVTIPKFWIKLEPVGLTFVNPPFGPTYTTSPSLNWEVLTPFIYPDNNALPSASLASCSSSTKVPGIVDAIDAEAAMTSTTLPDGGEADDVACTGVPL